MSALRTTSRTQRTPGGRPSAAWLPGTLLGILGVALLVAGLLLAAREHASESQTATALAQMRSHIWAVRSAASAALLDQPGSMATLTEALGGLSASEQLMEKGGLLRSTDKTGVSPLSDIQGVSGVALRDAVSALIVAARQFQDNARGLDTAAQVLAQQPGMISTVNAGLATWQRLPGAQVPPEVLAALDEVNRTSRPALEALFPFNGTLSPAQAEAVSRALGHARLVRAAADAAPPAQKAAASSLADAVNSWAESLRALASSQPYREAAASQWPGLASQAVTADAALLSVQQSLDLALDRWRLGDYLAIVGGVLAAVGIFWWVYVAWSSSTQQWALSQDHRSALDANVDIDALSRQLAHIVNHHGEVISGEKLRNVDPSSQTFALRATINRLLEARDAMARTASGRLDDLASALNSAEMVLSAVPSLGSGRWEEASVEARRRAERIALLASSFADARTRLVESREAGGQAHDIVNHALRETDGLRGDIQSGSKRVKRMGEVSQAIQMVADLLRTQLRRLHVLALNASIEAASMGPSGQAVAATAREMDGFIQNAVTAAAAIDDHVVALLDDAQEAIGAMERSSSALVANSQLGSRAVSSLRTLDRLLEVLSQFMAGGIDATERQALDLVESQRQYATASASARVHEERAREAGEALHRGKETLRAWGNELSERSRRI